MCYGNINRAFKSLQTPPVLLKYKQEQEKYWKGQFRYGQMKRQIKLIVFVTCAEYNRCRLDREMLTYKPLTNNAVQDIELRKYLLKKLKLKKSNQK